jgi:hypothetical protein
VSNPGAAIKGAEAAQQAEAAWRAVRDDAAIQYAPVTVPPEATNPPPEWLKTLTRWLGEGGAAAWPVLKWVLIAAFVALVLYALWKLTEPWRERVRPVANVTVDAWRPDRGEAEALLSDADALAAAGRFDEATHLLLRRSVSQIAAARAEWVRPASTARELAQLAALSADARGAFAEIAQRVERSRYALRGLDSADWQAARAAYAEFALARLPAIPA